MPSPIRWIGGKSRLRKTILRLLPRHTCYAEPFAGGAWVFFGKDRTEVECLNDLESELIAFYRVLRDQPQAFLQAFQWTLVARAEYERLRDTDPAGLDEVERAYRFYYLVMAGWGGELAYPRFQVSIGDTLGGGNRLLGALRHLPQRVWPVHERLQGVELTSLDWCEAIDRYDKPEAVLYLDPPYCRNTVNYSVNMRESADHVALAERLARARCRWVLSSYDTPEVRALYSERFVMPVTFASGMETARGSGERLLNREVLITNFWPHGALDWGRSLRAG